MEKVFLLHRKKIVWGFTLSDGVLGHYWAASSLLSHCMARIAFFWGNWIFYFGLFSVEKGSTSIPQLCTASTLLSTQSSI